MICFDGQGKHDNLQNCKQNSKKFCCFKPRKGEDSRFYILNLKDVKISTMCHWNVISRWHFSAMTVV